MCIRDRYKVQECPQGPADDANKTEQKNTAWLKKITSFIITPTSTSLSIGDMTLQLRSAQKRV
ncbi:MAG: hypothetical protein ACQUYJ_13995, partial [Ferruginibacter sp.]